MSIQWRWVLLGIMAVVGTTSAATITVGPGGGFDFETIQEAVKSASNFDDVLVAPSQQRTAFSFKSSENDFAFDTIFYGHRRKRVWVDNFKVGIILGIKMYAGMGLARDACWAVTAGRPHIVVNRGATESCFYLTKDLRDAATGLSGNHYFFNA